MSENVQIFLITSIISILALIILIWAILTIAANFGRYKVRELEQKQNISISDASVKIEELKVLGKEHDENKEIKVADIKIEEATVVLKTNGNDQNGKP